MLRGILHNPNLRRPQYTVLNHVPNLLTIKHSPRLFSWYWSLIQGFVEVGIEAVPCGVIWFDMVFEKSLLELSLGDFDARIQFLKILLSRF